MATTIAVTVAPEITITLSAGTGLGVSASAVLTDNAVVRGNGGSRGVQTSSVLIDDSDNITGVVNLSLTSVIAGAWNGTAIAITKGGYLFKRNKL